MSDPMTVSRRLVAVFAADVEGYTGAHIWADRFERDLTDVFALQDEVTAAVVSAIQPKLLQTEIALATRRRLENLTAYDFYLRALPQFYLATRDSSRFAAGPSLRLGRGSGRCLSHAKGPLELRHRSSIRP
jgi:hypothetical protein